MHAGDGSVGFGPVAVTSLSRSMRFFGASHSPSAIFTRAVGHDDLEYQRHASFDPGNLFRPYHSVNTDINKRIRYLGGKS